MSEPNTEPSLVERMLAKVTGTTEIKAELAKAEGALSEAVAKIADAEGRATAAEARASEAVAALEAANAAHAVALAEAVAAAKIEGAQGFAVHNLKASAPDGLPHVEEGDLGAFTTHTAREQALRNAGRLEEAAAYWATHKKEIFAGE